MIRKGDALETYWAEAAGWDDDRIASTQRRERLAWRVAAAAALLTVLSAITLMLLLPLKTVEPFVVRVDSSTGVVDIVPQYVGSQDFPETVTRYFLGRYVRTCERYVYASAYHDYAECGAFNSPELNQEHYRRWVPSNPESPFKVYGQNTTLRPQIVSITFLESAPERNVAQVRYLIGARKAGGAGERVTRYIATITYRYANPSRDVNVRQWNPLGLRIDDFRRELEVPEEHAPSRSSGTVAVEPEKTSL
ncbi:conjugal transfer protein TraJ [Steroidobacter agaridevorans]|uniref:Conjugal transfer protein TraJ n=1 Tax=Steroidobacter agaridevorans TaxID=2695856 RepID=A0A829YI29_9GAMM|nr:type IV secretion system protein [Steroidobacter agaridevorans]GFE82478.1 conjugal transfer protein TraJ [Steroidobacter agaridevorans]